MILGRIIGKVTTNSFKFVVSDNAKKFEYVQVMHKDGYYVLAQVVEVEKDDNNSIAYCNILGYKKDGRLKNLRTPLEPNSEVLKAQDEVIRDTLGLEERKNTAYIGKLEGREKLNVYLDLNKLLTRHVVIMAKSGMGKSVLAGDIVEDLIENKVPVVILDPHGEYGALRYPNAKDKDLLEKFGLQPKGYLKHVQEFTPDPSINPEAKPLKLNNKDLTATELLHLLPAKLSNSQKGTLYSAMKNLGKTADFSELIFELETSEENSSKWTLINILEYVKKLNLFSENYTLPAELVRTGMVSIINLKGVAPEISDVVVYKLVSDLFNERKKGNIPPFFLLLEEAHNFCPERAFGETKASPVLRQIAAEGRKFGLGMGVVSQRPSRVDKSVLSQASTQFILKVTNPNDLKAISNSVEGMTAEVEKEIKNTPIGTALVTGIVDVPLFVNIRPRRSKHGGEAVKIFSEEKAEEQTDFMQETKKFEDSEGEVLPVILPKLSKKDIMLMSEDKLELKTVLVPCVQLTCDNGKEFNILVDLNSAKIVKDTETMEGVSLLNLNLEDISPQQSRIFNIAMKLKKFKPAELFAKSGVQFSELYDLITILTKKNYLEKEDEYYKINDKLKIFTELEEYASYAKCEFV
ncbi:ATP-binding protein, partial [Candidatus Woesearchaeota archaeon]